MTLALILHGGAGNPSEIRRDSAVSEALNSALNKGWDVLIRGGSSEEAALSVLAVLEECPHFDAGYGSYPNQDGKVYQDVALMRGSGKFAALMNVPRLKFPSQLAADLLNSDQHNIALAWGDERMAEIEILPKETRERYGLVNSHEELVAPEAKRVCDEARAKMHSKNGRPDSGTVGCVARDSKDQIFAGTSTGGTPLKPRGRVGDSPIIGAGTYADNQVCGLSATGHGESILASLLSGYVIARARMEQERDDQIFERSPENLALICLEELERMAQRSKSGSGGLIIIPKHGPPVYAFNSRIMHVALRFQPAKGDIKEACGTMLRPETN